jgi:mRNA interferase MazF
MYTDFVLRRLARGDVWIVGGGSDYAGKPRPAVVLQDVDFQTPSATLCPLTSNLVDASLVRPLVEPDEQNGLRASSQLMTDKITTVSRNKLERRIGRLAKEDMSRLHRAVIVFLGLAR